MDTFATHNLHTGREHTARFLLGFLYSLSGSFSSFKVLLKASFASGVTQFVFPYKLPFYCLEQTIFRCASLGMYFS